MDIEKNRVVWVLGNIDITADNHIKFCQSQKCSHHILSVICGS